MPSKVATKSKSSPSLKRAAKRTSRTENSNGKRVRTSSEEQTFIVEEILDKKKIDGIWRYKVKWQGYSEKECTWEPVKNLESVKDMVEDFNKALKHKEEEEEEEEDEEEEEEQEEKPVKGKVSKEKVNKAKPSKGKTSVDKEESSAKEMKASQKKHMGSPKKKVKTDQSQAEPESSSVKKTNYGHFKLGDKPKGILYAKKEKDEVIFTIEWEPRESGHVPLKTEMTSLELRKYDKDLLLDFYEKRLKFVKAGPKDSTKKSVNKEEKEDKVGKQDKEEEKKEENKENKMNEEEEEHNESPKENKSKQEAEPEKKKEEKEESENKDQNDSVMEVDEEGVEQENKKKEPEKHEEPIRGSKNEPEVIPESDEGNKFDDEQKKELMFNVDNIINNAGQTIFADLGFNSADDLRDLALDANLKIISQTNQDIAKPYSIKDDSQPEELNKGEPPELQLESPKEISDSDPENNLDTL